MYSQRQQKNLNHTNGIYTSILDPVINEFNLLKTHFILNQISALFSRFHSPCHFCHCHVPLCDALSIPSRRIMNPNPHPNPKEKFFIFPITFSILFQIKILSEKYSGSLSYQIYITTYIRAAMAKSKGITNYYK